MLRKILLLLLFLLLLTGLIILFINNHGDNSTKYYKCSGNNCIQDITGGKNFPNDPKCNSSCGGRRYYKK